MADEDLTRAVAELLDQSSPAGRFAWQRACAALEQGIDGTLIIHVPGIPGALPEITWVAGARELMIEVIVRPCSLNSS